MLEIYGFFMTICTFGRNYKDRRRLPFHVFMERKD